MVWFVVVVVVWDRVLSGSPSCHGSHSVVQAGLELRGPLASASQVLGLKTCTNAELQLVFYFYECMGVFSCVFVYAPCLYLVPFEGLKKASDSLDLGLQMAMHHRVRAKD